MPNAGPPLRLAARGAPGALRVPARSWTEQPKSQFLERIAVETRGQVRVVPVKQIDYITPSGPYGARACVDFPDFCDIAAEICDRKYLLLLHYMPELLTREMLVGRGSTRRPTAGNLACFFLLGRSCEDRP